MTETLLERDPDLEAIYYSNDDLALCGAFHCLATGLQVPSDLMLAGFNGLDLVRTLPSAIATSLTPRREIGQAAAQIVLSNRDDDKAGHGERIEFSPQIDLGL